MKPLRNAGISVSLGTIAGIVLLFYLFFRFFAVEGTEDFINEAFKSASPLPLVFLVFIVSIIILFFIFHGFISLGKRFNNNLLTISAWVSMIVTMLYATWNILFFVLRIHFGFQNTLFYVHSIFYSIVSISTIFLGIGLLKLKENVEHSKTIGILYIITPLTLIVPIIGFLFLIAQIFVAKMFFKESKKFE